MDNTTHEKIFLIVQDLTNFLLEKNLIFDQSELKQIISLCQELTAEYDESHDINHHVSVFKNSILIFEDIKDKLSEEYLQNYLKMITYSSLLHDTIDHKYPINLDAKKISLDNFLKSRCHCLSIKWIIDNMSYSKEVKNGYPQHMSYDVQTCRDIVSDADKLEAIGEIGIKRCRDFSIATNPGASEEYTNKLVIEHCHEKLLNIKDKFIRTKKGKELAEPLHQFLVKFINDHE